MKKKRIIALLMALVMLSVFVVACGTKDTPTSDTPANNAPANDNQAATTPPPPSTSAEGGLQEPELIAPPEEAKLADHIEIVMAAGGLSSINPHLGASGGMNWFTYIMIYDNLIERVQGGDTFAPMLAKSWETTDFQTFVFELRDDVYFHDGEHLDADAIVWNIEYSQSHPEGEASMTWSKVATAKALGPYTLELVTNDVEVDFLYEIANPYAGMISPKSLTENPETGSWIGSGPWKVTSFVSDVLFERNEDYWGEIPVTKTLALRDIPDPSARRMMMLNGECDFSFGISGENVASFENDPRFTIYPQRSPMIFGLWFNMQLPITGDRNFRLAVAHALNLDEITIVASGGNMADTVTGGTIWGRATQFRRDDLPNREQNLELAKQYLEDSIYNGEQIVLTTAIEETNKGSEVVQQQLAEIGIDIFINVTDMPGFIAMNQPHDNQIQMALFMNNPSLYASSMRQFIETGSIRNGTSYSNPRVDELLTQAMVELDINKREAIWQEIQGITYDDIPQIPVFWLVHGYVSKANLGGFYITEETSMHNFRNVFLALD